mgnify:FL=1
MGCGSTIIKSATVQGGIHEKLRLNKEIELSFDKSIEEKTDQWHLQEHMTRPHNRVQDYPKS